MTLNILLALNAALIILACFYILFYEIPAYTLIAIELLVIAMGINLCGWALVLE